ncbi:MAG: hypothetical protein OXB86_06730 [Bdellovibrionales bacterium]|nr:hypothetical protein [Bdellovibrionales bacterium]
MEKRKKASTIYLQPEIHKALKLKSVMRECSISDLAEEIIRISLKEDIEDIKTIKRRKKERSVSLDDFIETLKEDDKI